MLTVTESAREHLADLLDDAGAALGFAARILQQDQGYSLHLDQTLPSDDTFSHEGRPVLVIDDVVSQSLTERVLDVKITPEGPKLNLQ